MGDAIKFEELDGQIGLVTLDMPGKKVNTLGEPVLREIAELVEQLAGRDDLNGLLFRSGKPGQFIAGADLNELGAMAYATPDDVANAISQGHALFTKISQLPFPTVALVDGNSMGGGTELILSMDYRLASDSPKTKIALPEVNIGLIPGWGGTQRLPRLIGISNSINMICGGETVDTEKAASWGLVWDVVPAEALVDEGRRLIEITRANGEWQSNRATRSQPLGLTSDQMNFAFACAEGHLRAKTKGQYPAPLAALNSIKEGINRPLDEGLAVEQEIGREIVGSPISAALIGVFFMGNHIARDPGLRGATAEAEDISRVGVLGSGLMGGGIATANARRGISTAMVDVSDKLLHKALANSARVVEGRIKIGRATPADMQQMLGLLNTSTAKSAFSDCDVVVEAVPEIEDLKKQQYQELAEVMKPGAILASNTSTISITRMAEASRDPERFVGMHFFSPVDRMKLVEVIRGEKTSDETVATVVALAKKIGKTPIVMNDCAGFLVNRILLPYMNESLLLLTEGASMDEVDKAATRFGLPMGPIALNDMVGIDVSYYAGKVVAEAYADRAAATPLLGDLVEAGRLGKKTGAGFRTFNRKGKPVNDPDFEPFLEKHRTGEKQFSMEELQDRLFLPMLLEATRCLEDDIVPEPTHVDMGLILGIGFPPFRGGILRWCDSITADGMLKKLEPYESLGKRYEATDILKQKATAGELFYPRP
ncbi:MAG: 3-hydroxyacyl-CoA dehydrogenase [Planctomycetaceae bacterium]|nr:3-hydroxyacyl-CoA dehydrogenase [Planctomycetaceae bacterium]